MMSRSLRVARLGLVAAAALAGITCRDGSSTGPGIPSRVSLAVAPSLSVAEGGPVIRLVRARATVRRVPGGATALDTVAQFPTTGDLSLALEVPLLQPTEELELLVRAMDAKGDTVYSATSRLTLTQGADPGAPVPLTLTYAGPDTVVHTIAVAPRDTTFRAGDSFAMRGSARTLNGDAVAGALFGWTSRDPAILAVNPGTGAVTATALRGSAWIVGATANGRLDSTRVFVVAPVARVDIDATGEVVVGRGLTRTFSAATRDADGTLLTGRAVTWTSTNAAGATVDAAGLVAALRADSVALIIATSEGKSDTVTVRVGRKPNARVQLSRLTDTLVVGATRTLTAAAFDSAAALNTDHPIVFTSLDTAIAKVVAGTTPGTATVTAAGVGGPALVRATAGAVSADYQVTVVPVPVRSIALTPRTGVAAAEDSLAIEATTKDSAGAVLSGRAVSFSVSDTAIATIRVLDGTHAMLLTKIAGTVKVKGEREGVADTATITVSPPRVAAVEVAPASVDLAAGDSAQLTATVRSARGTAIARTPSYRALDAAVATVSEAGWVRGVASGTTRIVAELDGHADTADVTVRQALVSLEIVPGSILIEIGATRTLEVIGRDANGNAMSVSGTPQWSIDDERIATVNADGVLRALAGGTATVRARVGEMASAPAYVSVGNMSVLLPPDTVRIGPNTILNIPLRLSRAVLDEAPIALRVLDLDGEEDPDSILALGDAARGAYDEYEKYFGPNELVQQVRLTAAHPGIVKLVAYLDTDSCDGSCGYGARAKLARAARVARVGRAAEVYGDDDAILPDTVVIKVEAAVAHLDRAVEVMPADSARARLELQSAAPAGGLRFVFDVSGAGLVRVRPDTVTVPAGQLAADVWVHGVREGSALVTPRAVSGGPVAGAPSSATVRARRLTLYIPDYGRRDTVLTGVGQRSPLASVVPAGIDGPITVAFSSSDEAVMKPVAATMTITASTHQQVVDVDGLAHGRAWLRTSAPGWIGDSVLVIVGTPHVRLTSTHLYDYDEDQSSGPRHISAILGETRARIGAETSDSTRIVRPPRAPLAVTFASSDTAVFTLDASGMTVPNAYQVDTVFGATLLPRRAGKAWLYARAAGHVGDSVLVTVTASGLGFYGPNTDYDAPHPMQTMLTAPGYGWSQSLSITGAPAGQQVAIGLRELRGRVAFPDSAFTASSLPGYVNIEGVRATALGVDTVVATAVGLAPDSLQVIVARPRLRVAVLYTGDSLHATLRTGESYASSLMLADSAGVNHYLSTLRWQGGPLGVALVSRDPSVVTADSVWLADGQNFFSARIEPRGAGTTWLVHETPGWKPDSIRITVLGAHLDGQQLNRVVGVGLQVAAASVSLGGAGALPVDVLPTSLDPGIATMPADTLHFSTNVAMDLIATGVAPGTARIALRDVTAGRAAFAPDTVSITVTRTFLGWEYEPDVTMALGDTTGGLRAVARDSLSHHSRYYEPGSRVARRALLRVRSTDESVLRVVSTADTVGGAPFVIARDSIATPLFRVVAVGAGRASIVLEDTTAGVSRFVSLTSRPITVYDNRAVTFDRSNYYGPSRPLAMGLRQRLSSALALCRDVRSGRDTLSVTLTTTDASVARGVEGGQLTDTVFAIGPASEGSSCAGVNVLSSTREGTIGIVATARRGASVVSVDTLRVTVERKALVVQRMDGYYYDSGTLFTNDSSSTVRVGIVPEDGGEGGGAFVTLDTLVVSLVTSDAALAAPESSTVMIPAGDWRATPVRVRPTGALGTVHFSAAQVRAGGTRYDGARTADLVVRTPRLMISAGGLGAPGQRTTLYVQSDNYVTPMKPVTYRSLDPAIARIPGSGIDSLPRDATGTTLEFVAVGTTRIVATSPGQRPDTLVVTVGTGTVKVYDQQPTQLYRGNTSSPFRFHLSDSTMSYRLDLLASDTVTFDVSYDVPGVVELRDYSTGLLVTQVKVHPGQSLSRYYTIRGVGAGQARITLTRAGYQPKTLDRVRVLVPPS